MSKEEFYEEVKKRKYELKCYFTKEQRELDDVHTYQFKLLPFEITGAYSEKNGEIPMSEKDKEVAVNQIKKWLFKMNPRPFRGTVSAWTCKPHFDEVAQKYIRQLGVMEAL